MQQYDDYLDQENKNYEQFKQYLIDNKQQELIDRYQIINNKYFETKQIVQIMNKYRLNKEELEILNRQLIEQYCKEHNIKVDYNIISDFQNNNKETIAMWLTKNSCLVPRQWMHNLNIKDNQKYTLKKQMKGYHMPIPYKWQNEQKMSIFDQTYFGIVPDIENHKPEEQDQDGFTVAMILAYNNIDVPKEWQHDPSITNKFSESIFQIYIKNKTQPPQWFYLTPEWKYYNGNTQAMIIAQNNFTIPKYLYHNPTIQNDYGFTVAMIQANNWKIQDKQWYHNKYLRCHYYYDYDNDGFLIFQDFYTVQNIFQDHQIEEIPNEWKYEPLNEYEDNQSIIDAKNGDIPELGDNDPEYQNIKGDTVAIILAQKGIIPPREWMHDIDLQNRNGNSIMSLLLKNNLPVPHHWHDDDMTIFDKACYEEIPNIEGHKSNEQNEDWQTISMILMEQDIEVPDEWYHDPIIQVVYGDTFAMIYIKIYNSLPSINWMHDIDLKNSNDYSIKTLLQAIHAPVPYHWNDNDMDIFDQAIFDMNPNLQDYIPDKQNQDGWTMAMILAYNGKQIPSKLIHKPTIKNNQSLTVAMILASSNCEIPNNWLHDPTIQDNKGWTVAMILAQNGTIPPKEWYRNPLIHQQDETTVGMLLANNGIIPPEEGMHNIYLENQNYNTIYNIICYCGYIYVDNQFIPNCKTQLLNNMCQTCLNEDKQQFVVTNCGHKICQSCFICLFKQNDHHQCPICRKEHWYQHLKQQFNDQQFKIKIKVYFQYSIFI